jgi:putative glycosyltransferase (TIGR04372 family)
MSSLKNLEKLIFILKIIILSPLIILIILVYPILKIKIFEMETRAIGHMALPMEIFASEIKEKIHNNKRTIYLWFPNKKIANSFLFKKWKENFIVLPRIILEPIYLLLKNKKFIKIGKYFLTPYRHWKDMKETNIPWQDKDIYNVLTKTKPSIIFSKNEIDKGNEYLSKFNISKEDSFVTFFFRNPSYYLDNKIIPSYKVNLRDQIKLEYYSSVDYLNSINCKTFLLGNNYPVENKNKNLIYYNQSHYKNDFLDMFLSFHCKYMVASASGIHKNPALNRRSTLVVNFSELFAFNHLDTPYIPIVIPKKFKSIKGSDLLTYSEVLDLKLSEYHLEDDLNKAGFEIIENTASEISDAVKEMEYFNKNNKLLDISSNELQDKFDEHYYNKFNYKIRHTKISSSFLKKNKDLFI